MEPNIVFKTAHELAHLIRSRDLSAVEVLEAHLRQINTHSGRLSAIATLNEQQARSQAQQCDTAVANGEEIGPLHGVPVTIKDSFETAGLRTTSSYKRLSKHVPGVDATVVKHIKRAGAIILAKTNVPILSSDAQCNSPLFGRANNPWNETCTPGGSTGGGAACVASGMSPLEIGSDLAGSIRLPAHYCGVFGMKPSEYSVSMAGHIPEPPGAVRGVRHMAVPGPLARCIEDLRLALSLIAGADGRNWEVSPNPFVPASPRPLHECRIAWTDDLGLPITAETRRSLQDTVDVLEKAGCHVERAAPVDLDFDIARETYGELLGAEISVSLPYPIRKLTRALIPFQYWSDPIARAFWRGARLRMPRYAKALARRDTLTSALDAFLSGRDAWLCPVAAGPAFTHRRAGQRIEVDDQSLPYWTATLGFTCIFNLTGNPVVTIPIGHSEAGLPIGVQMVGRRWHDMELLAVVDSVARCTSAFAPPLGFG